MYVGRRGRAVNHTDVNNAIMPDYHGILFNTRLTIRQT